MNYIYREMICGSNRQTLIHMQREYKVDSLTHNISYVDLSTASVPSWLGKASLWKISRAKKLGRTEKWRSRQKKRWRTKNWKTVEAWLRMIRAFKHSEWNWPTVSWHIWLYSEAGRVPKSLVVSYISSEETSGVRKILSNGSLKPAGLSLFAQPLWHNMSVTTT